MTDIMVALLKATKEGIAKVQSLMEGWIDSAIEKIEGIAEDIADEIQEKLAPEANKDPDAREYVDSISSEPCGERKLEPVKDSVTGNHFKGVEPGSGAVIGYGVGRTSSGEPIDRVARSIEYGTRTRKPNPVWKKTGNQYKAKGDLR